MSGQIIGRVALSGATRRTVMRQIGLCLVMLFAGARAMDAQSPAMRGVGIDHLILGVDDLDCVLGCGVVGPHAMKNGAASSPAPLTSAVCQVSRTPSGRARAPGRISDGVNPALRIAVTTDASSRVCSAQPTGVSVGNAVRSSGAMPGSRDGARISM